MPDYVWRAVTVVGKVEEGRLTAPSSAAVLKQLREQGLTALRIDDAATTATVGQATPKAVDGLASARGKWHDQPVPTPMPRPLGRIVVFGDSDFITNAMIQRGTTGNSTLFRNAVTWAAAKEYKTGIRPQPFEMHHPEPKGRPP